MPECTAHNCTATASREGQLCSAANHPEIVEAGVAPSTESEQAPSLPDDWRAHVPSDPSIAKLESELPEDPGQPCKGCGAPGAFMRAPDGYLFADLEACCRHAATLRARVAELEGGMKDIAHSMTMALVPGNDRMREIRGSLQMAKHFIPKETTDA